MLRSSKSVIEWGCRMNSKFRTSKKQTRAFQMVQNGTVAAGKKKKRNHTLNIQNGLMHGHLSGMITSAPPPVGKWTPGMVNLAMKLCRQRIIRRREDVHAFVARKRHQARRGGRFARAWCGIYGVAF